MTMLFLNIHRAACAAAAACALFAINNSAAACEDEGCPAAPIDAQEQGLDQAGIPEGVIVDPVGPRVIVPDSPIAAITQAANLGEILQSRLALTRASDPAVLSFAQMMIEHHTQLIAQQEALLAALGAAPLENTTSRMLTANNALQMAQLMPLSGPEFDLAYMNAQIEAHRIVLNMVDTQLLPSAQDPRVRDMLSGARPVIAEHLAEAESIQSTLGTRR
jgi:putative membrane protein